MPVKQTTERWFVNEDGSKVRSRNLEHTESVNGDSASDEYPVARTHAEADEQAAARGLTFPEENMTVKAKAEFLAGA